MSFPTQPAFIATSTGSWEPSRVHPAMAWLEKHTKAFENHELTEANFSDWHTDDMTFQKANGEIITGGLAAFKASLEVYQPFATYMHEPKLCVVWENENGYEMIGHATLFADFVSPGGEKKAEDSSSRKWDVGLPGMFQFAFVKVSGAPIDGLKLGRIAMYSDSGPVVVEMIKRGMVQANQLLS